MLFYYSVRHCVHVLATIYIGISKRERVVGRSGNLGQSRTLAGRERAVGSRFVSHYRQIVGLNTCILKRKR